MTFLTPLLAGIAAAVAVPTLLILYFLKLRRRDVEVSTTLLWKQAIQDMQANAPFQRLRRNILLLLQLLALAGALLALAQPEIRGELTPGQELVLIIDRSASMQSTDGSPDDPRARQTRLDRAKAQALEMVDAMKEPGLMGSAGDRAMLIAFDTSADILTTFTANKAELRRLINDISATDSPSSFAEAFKLAKAHLRRRIHIDDREGGKAVTFDEQTEGGALVHLFSDGRIPDLSTIRAQREDQVVYHRVGRSDAWNLGIVSVRAERDFNTPSSVSVFVAVQSTSRRARTVDVQLSLDGRVVAVRPVELPAAQTVTAAGAPGPDAAAPTDAVQTLVPSVRGAVFELSRAEGASITVQLRHPDVGLPEGTLTGEDLPDPLGVDDVAYVILPPARRLSIAMVSEGNFFLTRLLRSMNLTRPLQVVPPSQAQAFIESKDLATYDLVVLDRWLPTRTVDGTPTLTLPPGRSLVLGAIPAPPLGLTDQGEAGATVALNWRRDHPTLRAASLENLIVNKGRKSVLPDNVGGATVVLAEGQDGPLIIEAADITRSAIITTFDPVQSNWVFQSGYPLFLVKAVEYLSRGGIGEDALTVRPGSTLTQRLPQDAREISMTLPDSARVPLVQSDAGDVNFGPVADVGIYTLAWQGTPGPQDATDGTTNRRTVAANLADPAESDLASADSIALASKVVQAQGDAQPLGARRLWPWLVLVALAVLMIEWWVYNRRVAF